ncbi:sialidase-like protein [Trypanosoma conorhini]|uniref:Sialidase-like protein n=1 Tax=Trypanosoma conorhini TaxID=83891 RepID=A0A3R7JYG3_9TRYP|nr:sialidase-like protein [Trypanosoma conorhini]RNE97468.1 sialidase-like protein [Trypanosoma conorhini]
MQATGRGGKNVLLSMRLMQSDNQWTLSSITVGEGCRDPSVEEWGVGGNLLAMARCAGGYYDVYDSTEAGTAWYEIGEPITRVWGNSLRRQGGHGVQGGLTTADIEDTEVMLLTTPVYAEDAGAAAKAQLHLWLTDMQRVSLA